jgi:hypothetical protein
MIILTKLIDRKQCTVLTVLFHYLHAEGIELWCKITYLYICSVVLRSVCLNLHDKLRNCSSEHQFNAVLYERRESQLIEFRH